MRHLSLQAPGLARDPIESATSGFQAWARVGLCIGALVGGMPTAGHTAQLGDPAAQGSVERGRQWLLSRHETGCILCHEVVGIAQGGQLGPPLRDLARRYGAQELSARIADARQFNPQTIMPPYRSTAGLQHVAPTFQGKPVLTEQALADIVSYLLHEHEPAARPSRPSDPPSPAPNRP